MSEAALTKALIEMGRQCIQAEEERDAAIARAEKAKADIKLWKGVVEQERSAKDMIARDREKAEVEAAAMRGALVQMRHVIRRQEREPMSLLTADVDRALASDAGAALLAAHKAEVDKLRKLCGEAAEMQDRILISAVMGWQGYGWADDASDLAVRLNEASR